VLLSRISDGSLCNAPIWDDVKTLSYDRRNWPGIDIIYGGFPCQDISVAGTKKGLDGERSSLFYHITKLANQIKPTFVFLENVSNIVKIGGNKIIKEFDSLGMECRWCCISAQNIGAMHKRDRWFMLAYSNSKPIRETYSEAFINEAIRITRLRSSGQDRREKAETYWSENKCPVLGMAYGLPNELDRSRALGNAVVPQQAEIAFKILIGIKD
jgi:DNA (cytosine-5)-methyltransferase 1